jgi:uncharacterized membrane protein required for colicin V production
VNGYDLIVLAALVLLGLLGLRRGLVGELVGLVAFVAALALAFRYDGPVGAVLRRLPVHLTPTEGRIVAFVVIVVAVDVAAAVIARRLGRLLSRVPVLGSVNRAGGLVVGLVTALIGVWLLTSALLVLPTAYVPWATTVHRSETARLLPSVTPRWDRELRAYVDDFTAGHVGPSLDRELRRLSQGKTSGTAR